MMSRMIFSKYSNDRKSEFQIVTSIYKDEDGRKWVEKRARHAKAQKHIDEIVRSYALLCEYNNNEKLKINACIKNGKAIIFEYVQGKLLSNVLTDIINSGDYLKFIDQIKEYAQLTKQLAPLTKFKITKEFIDIFGEVEFTKDLEAGIFTNVDFTFDNIIINEYINVIDYEWFFEFPIPVNYVIYRAINVYRMKESLEEEINLVEICKLLEITKEEIEQYNSMEVHFQEYVNKQRREVKQPIRLNEILNFKDKMQQRFAVQVFKDYGSGFSEANSFRMELEEVQNAVYKMVIGIDENIKSMRIDPLEDYCIIQIKSTIFSNGLDVKIAEYETNAIEMDGSLIFLHKDPQIVFNVEPENRMKTLEITFRLENITIDAVSVIQNLYTKQQKVLREYLQLKQETKHQSQGLTQSLEEKESQLIELQKQIQEKNQMCIQLDKMLEDVNSQITQVTNELTDRTSQLTDRIGQVEQTQIELAKMKKELEVTQQELQQIKDSSSWKLLTKIRNNILWKWLKR